MGAYLGQRIIDEVYTYEYVISKRPDLQTEIDQYLIDNGEGKLIVT